MGSGAGSVQMCRCKSVCSYLCCISSAVFESYPGIICPAKKDFTAIALESLLYVFRNLQIQVSLNESA